MKVDRHTILHRKDETGVIVESGVFGPDDEIPKGFGPQEFEVVQVGTRVVEMAESKLTPWDEAAAKAEVTQVAPEDLNEGTPIQARLQAGAKPTKAEKEALKALDDSSDADEDDNEVSDGSPVQGKEAAGVKLTEAERKPGEESGGRSSRR